MGYTKKVWRGRKEDTLPAALLIAGGLVATTTLVTLLGRVSDVAAAIAMLGYVVPIGATAARFSRLRSAVLADACLVAIVLAWPGAQDPGRLGFLLLVVAVGAGVVIFAPWVISAGTRDVRSVWDTAGHSLEADGGNGGRGGNGAAEHGTIGGRVVQMEDAFEGIDACETDRQATDRVPARQVVEAETASRARLPMPAAGSKSGHVDGPSSRCGGDVREPAHFVSAARTEADLLADIFSYCREHLPYAQLGVFFCLTPDDLLVPTESYGFGAGELKGIAAKRGVGLTGVAAMSGRPQLRFDLASDVGETGPARLLYSAKGVRSAAALVVATGEMVFGVLVLYSTEPEAFTLTDASVVQGACATAASQLASIRALRAMRKEVEEAHLIIDMARHLSPDCNVDELISFVIGRAKEMVGGDVASVMLADPATNELRIGRADGLDAEVAETVKLTPGSGIAGWVAQKDQALIVSDFPADDSNGKVKWAACVPLRDGGKVIGVLNVGSVDRYKKISDDEMRMLTQLASQAGTSIQNARALRAIRELHFETMRALISALETTDPYGRGHSESVARYAAAIAEQLGLSTEKVRSIETAGMLHDVGKATLGEGLLRKGTPLTTVEQTAIQLHPALAGEILRDVPMFSEVLPAITHHHERYDGGGYGHGLSGADIPLAARILAVADAFDAMTSERPYRPARSSRDAAEELSRGAGSQFDPHIVEVFRDVLEREGGSGLAGADSTAPSIH